MTNEQAIELAKTYEQAWAIHRKQRVYVTYKGNGWFKVRNYCDLSQLSRNVRAKKILENLDELIDRAA